MAGTGTAPGSRRGAGGDRQPGGPGGAKAPHGGAPRGERRRDRGPKRPEERGARSTTQGNHGVGGGARRAPGQNGVSRKNDGAGTKG